LLQWDMARACFETGNVLTKYPEFKGVTHPVIRKAVGHWARGAVQQWNKTFSAPEHVLIGEVPIVGNRFVELVQNRSDQFESLLSDEKTLFFVPVPSREVREKIETKRQLSIANPTHVHEIRDAPINVLHEAWHQARNAAIHLGLVADTKAAIETDYDHMTYRRLYEHLLKHRNCRILHADTLYPAVGSVYDLDVPINELTATPAEVSSIFAELENSYSQTSIRQSVESWYQI